MAPDGLTPSHGFLREAAQSCFADRYGNPTMHINKPLSARLEWSPALRFTLHRHINVFVEPSDNGPYPRIVSIRYADIMNYPEPIAIYAVCPSGAIATQNGQDQLRRLKAHGMGLVTVDTAGNATILFSAIPIVHVIPEDDFKQRLQGLPRGIIRQRISEAFDDYRTKPVNGVKNLSEIVEGMIRKAGKDAAAKSEISNGVLQSGNAAILDALHTKYHRARAAIGGARNFYKECRNLAHHWPNSKKASYEKYTACRHHFLGGLQTIHGFRAAMRNVGLTGNLPRV